MVKTKKKPDFFVWLRSSLRKISQRHPPIYAALAAAKRPYTGDNPRQRVCYLCAKCSNTFSAKEVAVDHREDCGTLKSWDDVQGFMQRLFCDKDGLDILCHPCHDVKSYMAKHSVSEEEAIIQKMILKILKEEKLEDIIDFCNNYGYDDVSNAVKRRKALEAILKGV